MKRLADKIKRVGVIGNAEKVPAQRGESGSQTHRAAGRKVL